jgi:hypothetical protein
VEVLLSVNHRFGAEIGVFEGDTTVALLEWLPDLKALFCVDPFVHYHEFDEATPNKNGKVFLADYNEVEKTFRERIEDYRSIVWFFKNFSSNVAKDIPDESLNFVFIDGNHSYKFVKQDINLWSKKVKRGGLIFGHDFINKPCYGVIRAVEESFTDYFVDKKTKVWVAIKDE